MVFGVIADVLCLTGLAVLVLRQRRSRGFAQRVAVLLAGRPIDEGLAFNAASDQIPGVRERNREILLKEFPKSAHVTASA